MMRRHLLALIAGFLLVGLTSLLPAPATSAAKSDRAPEPESMVETLSALRDFNLPIAVEFQQTEVRTFVEGRIHMDHFSLTAIPEPATLGLVTAFGGAVLFIRRRLQMG